MLGIMVMRNVGRGRCLRLYGDLEFFFSVKMSTQTFRTETINLKDE
jgi:hypothetical protein